MAGAGICTLRDTPGARVGDCIPPPLSFAIAQSVIIWEFGR
nr:MAG TPA: hypothetical protein [Caudoviricetes sp.]